MKLDVIDSLAALEAFTPEWSSFTSTAEAVTPFQLPQWLLTWWRHFGSGHLHVMVFRANGEIAGIIPCFNHSWEGHRQITLLGAGISDYLEPVIDPDYVSQLTSMLWLHLLERTDWDVCNWQDLSGRTALACPSRSGGNHLQVRVIAETPCSEIRLGGSFEDFWAARSKDLRRNLRRYGQRAEQEGPIEFAVTNSAGEELLDALIRLHADRWHKRGECGMIEANRSAAFLRHIAREYEQLGMLRFFTLRFKGHAAALSIGFLYRNTLYSYLSAFDPQYEILGFGRRLLYESLKYAYHQRFTAWNFCRGDESYKYSFGAESIPKARLILTRAIAHTA